MMQIKRYEQRRHTDGTDLLDTAADAAQHDEHGQHHEDQTVDDGLALVADEGIEHLGAHGGTIGFSQCSRRMGAETGAEQVAHVQNHVLDAVAAQCAVEEQNKECRGNPQPAQPLELLAEDLVSAHGALAGLAAQSQLAHHDDEAAADRQNQIDDQECEAAAGAHLVGKSPDVAQADRRANSSHQESKIGSKAFSFFHCFLSLLLGCRPKECGVRRVYYFSERL